MYNFDKILDFSAWKYDAARTENMEQVLSFLRQYPTLLPMGNKILAIVLSSKTRQTIQNAIYQSR